MKKWILLFLLLLIPYKSMAEELIPNGNSGVLIEAGSGKILYEKNSHERSSVASLTKMVAQIIILEEIEKGKIHWDDVVTISHHASSMGGSQIYLAEGEKMTVRDLMKGISVASGNDATVAMAEYIGGSEEKFVERMNEVVKQMGLKDTHFVNSTGLDEEDHYSSGYDMAMIARELVMNHSKVLEFSSIYEDYLRENSDQKFWLVNTNKLIRFYEGADGLKTGHTDDAGYCLAATAKRDNMRLIGIVLGEKDSKVRNQEVMDLLDYGFQTAQMKCLLKKGTQMDMVTMDLATPSEIPIVLKEDLCVLEEKGQDKKYQYELKLQFPSLPVQKGDVVGKVDVLYHQKKLSSGDLMVSFDVQSLSFMSFVKKTLLNLLYGVL
ncbi:MAG: D-alanyl-D-alanine carboxypeptidase [Bacilli bacterium]|nr:D-alanyl-D-alanine carboxypeptidase [Bacilli bacterium]